MATAHEDPPSEVIEGETCPFCGEKTLTLMETERDVPYFGKCFLFSMDCKSCKYHKADVEVAEKHKPVKQRFEVSSEEDLRVRVVKSSNATLKVGTIGTIEPGEAANGYITNIEGILKRIQRATEQLRDAALEEGDKEAAKKAKNHLKKLSRVLWGQEKLTITLTDPTGNSAIISAK
ncbi:ZPR1 zinc finger domain-containing protein [Candidatus Woesearchaeota archaeon]|nr:MAG: ZPR1 zinc finger domain-containing protein [Candidatus Woesearchaeota archaeon]